MMPHTKGPWTYYSASKHYPNDSQLNYGSIIWATGYGEVAQTPGLTETGVDDANARLIAAAPDLLEALVAVRDWDLRDAYPGGDGGLWGSQRDIINAAIAKATGAPNV